MKRLNLILGIVCLVCVVGLTYANLTLPPESLMLQIGNQNMPWLGPIIFVVAGILFFSISIQNGESKMSEQTSKPAPMIDPEEAALNKRL